ncbi:MAG: ABC transporter permease subunit, partial [Sulfolobales archaeon]
MSVKERLFVEAAKAIGCGDLRILFKHVVPHAIPPALAYSILEIGAAIIMEAGLSYLGLGDPNYP